MTSRLPVDPRPSTWLDFSALQPRPLPELRTDPTTYIPRRSRANRLARLLRNAIVRGDVAAQLIVEGRIDALRRARVAPVSESGWTEAELREAYGK